MENNNSIKIPPYNWFINKSDNKPVCNTFTGSCDTKPSSGCAQNATFAYKVYVADVATENARFIAECYSVNAWNDGYQKNDISSKEAPCNDDGLVMLNEWLNQEHDSFLVN